MMGIIMHGPRLGADQGPALLRLDDHAVNWALKYDWHGNAHRRPGVARAHLIGLSAALPQITDDALARAVKNRIDTIAGYLRSHRTPTARSARSTSPDEPIIRNAQSLVRSVSGRRARHRRFAPHRHRLAAQPPAAERRLARGEERHQPGALGRRDHVGDDRPPRGVPPPRPVRRRLRSLPADEHRICLEPRRRSVNTSRPASRLLEAEGRHRSRHRTCC